MRTRFTTKAGDVIEGEVLSEVGEALEVRVTKENGKKRSRTTLFALEQLELAGAEASAKQLAASRGDMLRTKVQQEAPGGLFAERFDDTPDLFGEGR